MKFSKKDFISIIKEIEDMEDKGENIWLPIGILEFMYNDYMGHIDKYFHTPKENRNSISLYNSLKRYSRKNAGGRSVSQPGS